MAVEAAAADALTYVEQAKGIATQVIGIPEGTPLRSIHRVGVVGAGTMGSGISMNFLSVGVPVTLVDATEDALDRGSALIRRNFNASAAKGKFTADQVAQSVSLLSTTMDFQALAQCDLIIEAVYEEMAIKLDVFRRLDKLAKPGAILASNTSFLDINQIAAVTSRPSDVVGTHFFSPAHIMKLVEVVRGQKTAPDVLKTAIDLAQHIDKVPVVSGVCYGFIGNRMLMQRQNEALAMLLEGATPEQIDHIHTSFGMPMGPFQMADLAGVDIGWHRDPTRIDSISDALCARGRWGQKKSAGYYDYIEPRKPVPSPVTAGIIADFRAKSGSRERSIGEEEIVARTFYTMINEGARILEEGIAQRASDIDAVWVFGFGWPSARGGPMFWANRTGLEVVVETLERYRSKLPASFHISPLLRACARSGINLE
jgi:3-hydroxyacyl-CoA dehydrogenase